MRAQRWIVSATLVAVAGVFSTCSGAEQPHGSELPWLEVVAAVPADIDAAGVHLEVIGCDDTRPIVSRTLSFEASSLQELDAASERPTGQLPAADRSIRLAKDHFFAREPWSVPPGCYRTRIMPIDLHGRPIEGCTAARTPAVPLGPNTGRRVLMLARCGEAPFDTPKIADELNFAPVITELIQRPSSALSSSRQPASSGRQPASSGRQPIGGGPPAVEVCARARDAEADALFVEWSARDPKGRSVQLEPAHRREQVGDTLDTCIWVERSAQPLEVSATVFDGERHRSRGFSSHESLRLHRHGVSAASRSTKTIHVEAAQEATCPPDERAEVASWTYWIRRDGRLLEPTDALDSLEPGDQLEVELHIDGCGQLPVALTSSQTPVGGTSRRRVGGAKADAFDRDAGNFENGTHILGVQVPDTNFDVALEVNSLHGTVLDATGSPGG